MSMLKARALNEVVHAGSLEGGKSLSKGYGAWWMVRNTFVRSVNIAAEWKPKWITLRRLILESDEEIVETLNQIAQNARLTAQSYQQNRIRLPGERSPFCACKCRKIVSIQSFGWE